MATMVDELFLDSPTIGLVHASATAIPLADESVQCVVTSPPYWGLRKYAGEQELDWDGWRGAYGLEPTVEMYVQHTIEILREIRRVLRSDGVCFWNIGDSYAGSWGNFGGKNRGNGKQRAIVTGSLAPQKSYDGLEDWHPPTINPGGSTKPKDLCLIPQRVALAAQADGWWVRSDIIWHKPNPMPESCKDRPTDAYEHILMLTKSAKYYWASDAVSEPLTRPDEGKRKTPARFGGADKFAETQKQSCYHSGNEYLGTPNGKRNLRNVWQFATQPYKGAHFATFPEELPRRCIKAATSERGACILCGAPWEREIERSVQFERGSGRAGNVPDGKWAGTEQTESGDYDIRMGPVTSAKTLGWRATCDCRTPLTSPCLVLDPFGGSGTVGKVAQELGRSAILLDVAYSADEKSYRALARARIGVGAQP